VALADFAQPSGHFSLDLLLSLLVSAVWRESDSTLRAR
jgi:hypothetical protein